MLEDEMKKAIGTLVVESTDLLIEMETALLELEESGYNDEAVNSVFRAAHTIKGSAGLFGLDHVVRFTHVAENVLDRVRSREIPVTCELVGTLLKTKDHIAVLMDAVAAGELTESASDASTGAQLSEQLAAFLGTPTEDRAAESDAEGNYEGPVRMYLSIRFGPDSLRGGMDPIAFVGYLSTLGHVNRVVVFTELLPELDALDPETCYLAFFVELTTDASVATVEDVFEFVRDDSDIRVLTEHSTVGEFVDLVGSFGSHGTTITGALLAAGVISESDIIDGTLVARQETAGAAFSPDAEGSGTDESSLPASAQQVERGPDRRAPDAQSLRVEAARLDQLIETVGELVIASAGAALRASAIGDDPLVASIQEVSRQVEEVRDNALRLRMVPIGSTFNRFQRVVRDVSASLDKDVSLIITGGDTEVDKALVDQIGDPLTHLVRNSLDHGIEAPDVRRANGKPERGTLRMNAFHDSGTIVIEVEDDGGGIRADSVLAKAIDVGLVEADATLTDKEIYALIFEPGFSTASSVSDLSGRGVGLDVVKRNVNALRGTIEVESQLGKGAKTQIRLPLTLAIIDGFLVDVGQTSFVIPLDRVLECVELPEQRKGHNCMDLRGEVLPFIPLRSLVSTSDPRPKRENVVVVEYNGTKAGLIVDSLKGEFQTVIKPLGEMFAHVKGIGGSTILGDGNVALIVDVPTLIKYATDSM